jgi:hypothetical protein
MRNRKHQITYVFRIGSAASDLVVYRNKKRISVPSWYFDPPNPIVEALYLAQKG